MSLVTDLIAYLNAKASVTTLATGGIFDLTAPAAALASLPAIIVNIPTGQTIQAQTTPTSLAEARIQVICLSNSPNTARSMADAVRLVTDGFSGTWNSSTTVVWCKVDDIGDGITITDTAADTSTPDVALDLLVHYRISVPSYS